MKFDSLSGISVVLVTVVVVVVDAVKRQVIQTSIHYRLFSPYRLSFDLLALLSVDADNKKIETTAAASAYIQLQ